MGKQKVTADSNSTMLGKPEQTLQAIILADSFDRRFRPITLQRPRALMRLCNAPLIAYTVEFLAANGVGEILIFCAAHAEQIQQWANESQWALPGSGVNLEVIIDQQCISAGDALRNIYTSQRIKSDFLLVSGDLVTNCKVHELLKEHRERYSKDKNAIMTMVFKEGAPRHRTRSLEDDTIVAVDADTKQLLHIDHGDGARTTVPLEVFDEHPNVQFRSDLIDTRIDICAPEVLFLFADNFDWQHLRTDFVRNLITNEILGNKIYTATLKSEYASRVRDLRTYDSVSKDVIHRWTFPMTPDANWWQRQGLHYQWLRRNVYREPLVRLSRTCRLVGESVVGGDTEIGDDTQVMRSVIGRHCRIGKRCRIEGAYIWDGVIIGDDVTVHASILCDKVRLGDNVVIGKGCVLADAVRLGDGTELAEYTKCTIVELETKSVSESGHLHFGADDELDDEETERIRVGSDEHDKPLFCFRWTGFEEQNLHANKLGFQGAQGTAAIAAGDFIDDSDSERSEEGDLDSSDEQFGGAFGADALGAALSDDDDEFVQEVTRTIRMHFEGGAKINDIGLEIKGLRFGANKTPLDCLAAVLPTVLRLHYSLLTKRESGTLLDDEEADERAKTQRKAFFKAVVKEVGNFAPLFRQYIQGVDDEVECIFFVQQACEDDEHLHDAALRASFMRILKALYDKDVITEQAVLKWRTMSPAESQYVDLASKFITWLEEASEESSE